MADTPLPPPLPKLPLRLVRPRRLADELAETQSDRDRLRSELEAERLTVQVLRQQYSERTTGPLEDTIPGVGAKTRDADPPATAERASRSLRSRMWGPIVAALLGLAATAAGLRYPGLMGPINDVAKALAGAFQ